MSPRIGLVLVAVGVAGAALRPAAGDEASNPQAQETSMPGSILVHITHGPEHPTRAALGFAVAHAALQQGHRVTLFLAGDAVQLLRAGVLDHLTGLGTGNLRQLHDALVAGGATFYASGGSSQARGLSQADLAGTPVEFAGPPKLVELALAHDRLFTY